MSDEQIYVQCTMRQGNRHDVAWIPEDCARVGAAVSFKGDSGQWMITTVGTVRQPWSTVNERGRDWKSQRQASDI